MTWVVSYVIDKYQKDCWVLIFGLGILFFSIFILASGGIFDIL